MDERPGPSSGISSYAYLETTCAICLDQFNASAKSFVDSCRHVFCFDCIRKWSETNAVCPLCKRNFYTILYYVASEKSYRLHYIKSLCNMTLTPGQVFHFLSMHVKRFFSEFVETQDRRPVEILATIFGQYYYDSPTYFRVSDESDEGVIPDKPVFMFNGYKTVDSGNHETGSEPGGSASGSHIGQSIESGCEPGGSASGSHSGQSIESGCEAAGSASGSHSGQSIEIGCEPGGSASGSHSGQSIQNGCEPGGSASGSHSGQSIQSGCEPGGSASGSHSGQSIDSGCDPQARPETTNITRVSTRTDSHEVDSDDDCEIIKVFPLPPGALQRRRFLQQAWELLRLGKRKRDDNQQSSSGAFSTVARQCNACRSLYN